MSETCGECAFKPDCLIFKFVDNDDDFGCNKFEKPFVHCKKCEDWHDERLECKP